VDSRVGAAVIKLYEIDWGAEPFYWDVYDSQDNFIRVVEAHEFFAYLDSLRAEGVDFMIYTQDWYEYNLAVGGAVS
jgi:hypothetical protein